MHVIGTELADHAVCHHASLLGLLHSAQFSYLQVVSESVPSGGECPESRDRLVHP